MNIGIIGAGHIGGTLAGLFADAGHQVAVANSRGPETLRDLVAPFGGRVRAVTASEAADFGEVVVESVPFGRVGDLPADHLRGKIVIDTSNYYPQRDGQIDLGDSTQSEFVARHLGGARIVKAFNTIYFQHLQDQGDRGREMGARRAIFVAGDDLDAKVTVFALIEEIGFAPVDTGSLRDGGRRQQPGSDIYTQSLTRVQALEKIGGELWPKQP